MPTLLRWKGWRFHFFSKEGNEPPHIHVVKGRKDVKLWLDGECSVARNKRANGRDIAALREVTRANLQTFLEKWHDYFA